MNTKVLVAALVGAIASFLGGWLVFGYLLESFYKSNTIEYAGLMKNPPELWGIFVSGFFWCLLLAMIFNKWANVTTFAGGMMNAAWIGLLISLSFNFGFHSFYNLYTPTGLVVDSIVSTIFWAVIGGVIGMALGWGKKSPAI